MWSILLNLSLVGWSRWRRSLSIITQSEKTRCFPPVSRTGVMKKELKVDVVDAMIWETRISGIRSIYCSRQLLTTKICHRRCVTIRQSKNWSSPCRSDRLWTNASVSPIAVYSGVSIKWTSSSTRYVRCADLNEKTALFSRISWRNLSNEAVSCAHSAKNWCYTPILKSVTMPMRRCVIC